jgi:predicted ABC-type ATPase
MHLPILSKLKEGVTFPFSTLADPDNFGEIKSYWDWWWEEKYQPGTISRPEIIDVDDEILEETNLKSFADTFCHRNLISDPLLKCLNANLIPTSDCLDRELFRSLAMKAVAVRAIPTPEPWVVFTGGGYGSGKSTIIGKLSEAGVLPCRGMVGADMFKQLIPEYNLIKAVGDGRASYTVQKECVSLVKRLYPILLQNKCSFILDSSMSDFSETVSRIESAKKIGYKLMLVAVLTPFELTINQAMHRAKISRRFPHKKALPESHVSFRQCFKKYPDLFDRVLVYTNGGEGGKVEKVAGKEVGEEFKIIDSNAFNSALEVDDK